MIIEFLSSTLRYQKFSKRHIFVLHSPALCFEADFFAASRIQNKILVIYSNFGSVCFFKSKGTKMAWRHPFDCPSHVIGIFWWSAVFWETTAKKPATPRSTSWSTSWTSSRSGVSGRVTEEIFQTGWSRIRPLQFQNLITWLVKPLKLDTFDTFTMQILFIGEK